MTCDEIEPLLSDFIDGELAYDVASAMTAHIASCDDCTREYRALRRTVRFVRANGSTQMTAGTPGGVYEEFHRAILDETATAIAHRSYRDGICAARCGAAGRNSIMKSDIVIIGGGVTGPCGGRNACEGGPKVVVLRRATSPAGAHTPTRTRASR